MRCTLLIPFLWWLHERGEEPRPEPVLPELRMFLARARRASLPPLSTEAWLCQAFGVDRQRDWPVAPLTLALDGGNPEDGYWLRADPVHLRPGAGQLALADSGAFAISQDEADALARALNDHFAAEGMRFHAPHPERWYLRLDTDPGIVTRPLADVAGRNIEPFLPAGADALRWRRIWNEIQMLLHAHAVNEAREARGDPAVNSVWLWGGGRRSAVPGRHFDAVWSEDALALALGAEAHIRTGAPGAGGEHWLRVLRDTRRADDHHLLVLTEAGAAARRGDGAAWRGALAEFDRRWIGPLRAALKERLITELTLVAPGARSCGRFEHTWSDLLKFWRRGRPLADYVPAAPR